MKLMARPNEYNDTIGQEIYEWIAEGGSLTQYCEINGTPAKSTVIRWTYENASFATKYVRAREIAAEIEIENIKRIADEAENDLIPTENGMMQNSVAVARARLRIDTRMWYAKKLMPKRYGDKVEIENNVNTIRKMVMVVTQGDIEDPPTE